MGLGEQGTSTGRVLVNKKSKGSYNHALPLPIKKTQK